jgi:hypothetical protein
MPRSISVLKLKIRIYCNFFNLVAVVNVEQSESNFSVPIVGSLTGSNNINE